MHQPRTPLAAAGARDAPRMPAVRTVLLVVLMLLLPLQSLQAASMALCAPAGQAAHAGHGPAAQPPADAHDLHDHGATAAHHHHHADTGAPAATGDGTTATPADLAGSADLGACCHVVASLPVQLAALPEVPPSQATPRLQGLPALSHTTGGPFRPPRPLPA